MTRHHPFEPLQKGSNYVLEDIEYIHDFGTLFEMVWRQHEP